MFHKSFGWCYDVWPEQASSYALSGANGRYLLHQRTMHETFRSSVKYLACIRMHGMDLVVNKVGAIAPASSHAFCT